MPFLSKVKLGSLALKPSTGSHIEALDGVRGVAILMVVAAHAIYLNPDDSGPLTLLLASLVVRGTLGVPIFFAVSAFVLSISYFERIKNRKALPDWKHYAKRRAVKIFPPFLLALFLLTSYFYIKSPDIEYLKSAFLWMTGLANFIFINPVYIINGSFWSLLVEAQFYVVLPLAFLFLRRLPYPFAVAGLFLILFVPSAIFRFLAWENHTDFRNYIFALERFPAALDYFAWGCLFAGIYKSPRATNFLKPFAEKLGCLGLLTLFICIVYQPLQNFLVKDFGEGKENELIHHLTGVGIFLSLFFLFAPKSFVFSFFSSRALRFVGLVSYEWFLLHQPVFFESRYFAGPAHGNFLKFILILGVPIALTFLTAVLIYRCFSLPLLRMGRKDNPL